MNEAGRFLYFNHSEEEFNLVNKDYRGILLRLIKSRKFDPHNQDSKNDLQERISEFRWYINETLKKFPSFNTYDAELTLQEVTKEVECKASMQELFSPGKYLAHATYSSLLPQILKEGGFRSSIGRYNLGFIRQDEIQRWASARSELKDQYAYLPHFCTQSFYSWDNPNAGFYSPTTNENVKGQYLSDICAIFPSEYILRNVKNIMAFSEIVPDQNTELHLTNVTVKPTDKSVEDHEPIPKLNFYTDDSLCLDWREGYYIIPLVYKTKREGEFRTAGATEEFIRDHIIGIPTVGDGLRVEDILSKKTEINTFLANVNPVVSDSLPLLEIVGRSGSDTIYQGN